MASRNLYLGNIHPDTQTHELRDIFKRYGSLERCEVRFGGPTYSVAFGFVSYYSIVHAELAQRTEHGRIHRGRSLVVEFTKTTPGQHVSRNRREAVSRNGKDEKSNGRNQSRSYSRHYSYAGYRRSPSPFDDQQSSRHRSTNNDRRRNRDRSRSPYDRRSSSKRHHSSPKPDKRRSSYSHKDRK